MRLSRAKGGRRGRNARAQKARGVSPQELNTGQCLPRPVCSFQTTKSNVLGLHFHSQFQLDSQITSRRLSGLLQSKLSRFNPNGRVVLRPPYQPFTRLSSGNYWSIHLLFTIQTRQSSNPPCNWLYLDSHICAICKLIDLVGLFLLWENEGKLKIFEDQIINGSRHCWFDFSPFRFLPIFGVA